MNKKSWKLFYWSFNILSILACLSCRPESIENKPIVNEILPESFPKPIYDFSKNALTDQGFELGKALFYDGLLSRDGTIPCGECHRQDFAFTHHGHDLSHGIDNKVGLRNAQPLQNLAWQKSFGWDGGVFDLDLFAISPITNPVEMDDEMGNVLEKLRKTDKYPVMFEKAFGSKEINTERFLKALSQFMVSLVSANSKYDKVMRKEANQQFTSSELAGYQLFTLKCTSCHATEQFTDGSFRNNGLPPTQRTQIIYRIVNGVEKQFTELVVDNGRSEITENPSDKNKFKVPSLRNIEVTKPYMHDGRFATLDQVLDHYSKTVTKTENLDEELLKNGRQGIPLTKQEKADIIAFLKTLTDIDFLTNRKFSQ
jgi:cytochrome c peroxidase